MDQHSHFFNVRLSPQENQQTLKQSADYCACLKGSVRGGRYNGLLFKKKYLCVDRAEQVISNNVDPMKNVLAAGWWEKDTVRNAHCYKWII